ncbi:MAG: aldo/keto reductase [Candidatus Omnitrophica bacterium]|nr:aldo/keto reductase [Candidatus Omnitrophota bacterium]
MRVRSLGPSCIEATVVGLGTWAIGGWLWGGTDAERSIDAIRAGIDAGITLIDTAPAYGLGLAEELVGKAMEGRREELVIASKCGLVWDTDQGTFHYPEYDKKLHRHLGRESVKTEVEQSLKRLKIDCIDLMQTHWQDETTPIEETMGALLELKEEGKIRAIGASNATAAHMEEYRRAGALDVDQEKYSMIDRQCEEENLPYCQKYNIAFLAYSPLAMGLLTGKIGPDREFTGDDIRKDLPRFSKENREKTAALLNAMKPIAGQYNLTISQLVIAWTVEQPGVTHALVGARNPQQAEENAHAAEVELEKDDVQTISGLIEKAQIL